MILFLFLRCLLCLSLGSPKAVFDDQISKHLEVRQKCSATRCIFDSFLGVWKYGQLYNNQINALALIGQ